MEEIQAPLNQPPPPLPLQEHLAVEEILEPLELLASVASTVTAVPDARLLVVLALVVLTATVAARAQARLPSQPLRVNGVPQPVNVAQTAAAVRVVRLVVRALVVQTATVAVRVLERPNDVAQTAPATHAVAAHQSSELPRAHVAMHVTAILVAVDKLRLRLANAAVPDVRVIQQLVNAVQRERLDKEGKIILSVCFSTKKRYLCRLLYSNLVFFFSAAIAASAALRALVELVPLSVDAANAAQPRSATERLQYFDAASAAV